jgi:RNA polymerase sigma-70 factor (sigma-E family)
VPDAIRLAYLLTGDAALAEDLAHDAFARLIGRFAHLRDQGAFQPYLRRTVVNLAVSHFRRRKLERAYLEGQAGLTRPEAAERDFGMEEVMRRALLRLPTHQRAAVVLRFYEDLPEAQVAEILRCRPGTVRSRVARAMEVLREELGSELGGM